MCPADQGPQDPRLKPVVEDLSRIACDRVSVLGCMVQEKVSGHGRAKKEGKDHAFYISKI